MAAAAMTCSGDMRDAPRTSTRATANRQEPAAAGPESQEAQPDHPDEPGDTAEPGSPARAPAPRPSDPLAVDERRALAQIGEHRGAVPR